MPKFQLNQCLVRYYDVYQYLCKDELNGEKSNEDFVAVVFFTFLLFLRAEVTQCLKRADCAVLWWPLEYNHH